MDKADKPLCSALTWVRKATSALVPQHWS